MNFDFESRKTELHAKINIPFKTIEDFEEVQDVQLSNKQTVFHFPSIYRPLLAPHSKQNQIFWNYIVSNIPHIGYNHTDISVLTHNNKPINGIFEASCIKTGISYHVLGKNNTTWKNLNKIDHILDFLDNCNTKYILHCDSFDAIFTGNFDLLISSLEFYEAQALFNSEELCYPQNINIEDEQRRLSSSPFCFLNSGCFFGYTEYIKQLFQEAKKKIPYSTTNPLAINSDQGLLNQLYIDKYKGLKIDDQQICFICCDFGTDASKIINTLDRAKLEER